MNPLTPYTRMSASCAGCATFLSLFDFWTSLPVTGDPEGLGYIRVVTGAVFL